MKYSDKVEKLNELNSDNSILLLDGFEKALIGYTYNYDGPVRAIYDVDKCIKILISRDKMSSEQAWEYFDYNTLGSMAADDPRFPILIQKF